MMIITSFDKFINITESVKSNIKLEDLSFAKWQLNESQGDPIRAKVASMSKAEASEKAEKIMEMCNMKIFTHYPMFRPFLKVMPPIGRHGAGSVGPDGIGTMSTSGSAIFYDPKFVVYTFEKGKIDFKSELDDKTGAFKAMKEGKRYPSDYATFVVIHEIMHNSLKHFLRKPPHSDYLTEYEIHQLWNIATDYGINHILKSDSRSGLIKIFPGGVDAEEGPFKAPAGEEEFFTSASAEKIFWKLLKNLEEKRKEEQGETEDDQEQEGQDDQEQEGEDNGEDENEEEGDSGNEEGEDEGDGGEEGDSGNEEGEDEGDGGSGSDGDGGEGDSDSGVLKVGDIIMDHDTGSYGRVSNISGDDIEWDEISKEEAMTLIEK